MSPNVSVYLMFLSRFIVKCKKEIEIWVERQQERTRYAVLSDPSLIHLLYVKEGENAMWQAPQGRSVQFFLPNRISRLCLYEKNKKDLIRFGRRQRVGVNATSQILKRILDKKIAPTYESGSQRGKQEIVSKVDLTTCAFCLGCGGDAKIRDVNHSPNKYQHHQDKNCQHDTNHPRLCFGHQP